VTERERMKSVILDWMGRHDVVLREQAFTTLLQMMLELEGRRTTPDREAIIEECAKVCEGVAAELLQPGDEEAVAGAVFCRDAIRALKTAPNGEKK